MQFSSDETCVETYTTCKWSCIFHLAPCLIRQPHSCKGRKGHRGVHRTVRQGVPRTAQLLLPGCLTPERRRRGGLKRLHAFYIHSTCILQAPAQLPWVMALLAITATQKLIQGNFNFNESLICCSPVKGLRAKGHSAPAAPSSMCRLTKSDTHSGLLCLTTSR